MGRFASGDRDLGLRRVSRVTKWLVAGAVAAVGIVTAVVADAAPGNSRTSTPPTPSVGTGTGTSNSGSGVANPSDQGTVPPTVDPSSGLNPPDDQNVSGDNSSGDDSSGNGGLTPPTDPPIRTHRRQHADSGGS